MTGMDDWYGLLAWMTGIDDWQNLMDYPRLLKIADLSHFYILFTDGQTDIGTHSVAHSVAIATEKVCYQVASTFISLK